MRLNSLLPGLRASELTFAQLAMEGSSDSTFLKDCGDEPSEKAQSFPEEILASHYLWDKKWVLLSVTVSGPQFVVSNGKGKEKPLA